MTTNTKRRRRRLQSVDAIASARAALPEDGDLLSTGEVAELFAVTPAAIRQWISDGHLDTYGSRISEGAPHRIVGSSVRALFDRLYPTEDS